MEIDKGYKDYRELSNIYLRFSKLANMTEKVDEKLKEKDEFVFDEEMERLINDCIIAGIGREKVKKIINERVYAFETKEREV